MSAPTLEKLRQALARVSDRELGPLAPDQPLVELGLDSIAMTDLVMVLEDDFGVNLEREDMEGLTTLADLVVLLEKKQVDLQ